MNKTPKSIETQFKAGQIANPSGRPKCIETVRELARKYTESAILTIADIMNDEEQLGSVRISAADMLLSRAWGRTEQSIKLGPAEPQERDISKLTTSELKQQLYFSSLAPANPNNLQDNLVIEQKKHKD